MGHNLGKVVVKGNWPKRGRAPQKLGPLKEGRLGLVFYNHPRVEAGRAASFRKRGGLGNKTRVLKSFPGGDT